MNLVLEAYEKSREAFGYRRIQTWIEKEYGITLSISRKGNCLDNAPTESFFSHLKEELLRHIKISDFQEAVRVVDDYIYFYLHDRIQLKKTDAYRI